MSGIVAKQVVVFLENRPGHLAHVTGVIAQEKINIRSVTIASAGSFGLVKLIVDRPEDIVGKIWHPERHDYTNPPPLRKDQDKPKKPPEEE